MNYLSHHFCAQILAPGAPDVFFVGNVLPDIAQVRLSISDPIDREWGELARGVRFHQACDRTFHASATFKRLCSEVAESLRKLPLQSPPRRTFFLAHVAVELAMDGILSRKHPGLAADLLSRLPANKQSAVDALLSWRPDLTPEISETWSRRYEGFVHLGFVDRYGQDVQLADSLVHLAERAGPGVLPDDSVTRVVLASWFSRLRENVAPSLGELLSLPDPAWYNSGTS